jgi:hypothetical protein
MLTFILAMAMALSFTPGAWAKKASPMPVATAEAGDNSTPAGERAPSPSDWYFGFGTGVDLPGSNWGTDYLAGGGGQGFLGYRLCKDWAAQLDMEQWYFMGGANALNNLRALVELKYTFGGKGLQPYILAGAGTVFQTSYPSGCNTANFDALGGVGIQADLGGQSHFYLEAKYNFILPQSGSFNDVPITAGVWTGL